MLSCSCKVGTAYQVWELASFAGDLHCLWLSLHPKVYGQALDYVNKTAAWINYHAIQHLEGKACRLKPITCKALQQMLYATLPTIYRDSIVIHGRCSSSMCNLACFSAGLSVSGSASKIYLKVLGYCSGCWAWHRGLNSHWRALLLPALT